MNKLIITDWGGVIENHSFDHYNMYEALKDITKQINPENPKILRDMYHGKTMGIIGLNALNSFVEGYLKSSGSNISANDFRELYDFYYGKIFYYQNIVNIYKKMKDKYGCKLAVLSNLCAYDYSRLDKQLGLKDFDFVFLSYELQLAKPDIDIYKKVEELSGYSGEQILFIDDNVKNIRVANEINWNTCLATGDKEEDIFNSCLNFLEKE